MVKVAVQVWRSRVTRVVFGLPVTWQEQVESRSAPNQSLVRYTQLAQRFPNWSCSRSKLLFDGYTRSDDCSSERTVGGRTYLVVRLPIRSNEVWRLSKHESGTIKQSDPGLHLLSP